MPLPADIRVCDGTFAWDLAPGRRHRHGQPRAARPPHQQPGGRHAFELSVETLTGETAARFAETERAVAREPGADKDRFDAPNGCRAIVIRPTAESGRLPCR
ncbi:MAG: hypothetical protein GVY13_10320 [Alphaproteobacteria bacterium]|nr:hypothetical protein [Alphaproteobacteria bacterium]